MGNRALVSYKVGCSRIRGHIYGQPPNHHDGVDHRRGKPALHRSCGRHCHVFGSHEHDFAGNLLALFCDAECLVGDLVVHRIQSGISTLQTVPDHLHRVLDIDPNWRVHLMDSQPNHEDKGHPIIAKVIK